MCSSSLSVCACIYVWMDVCTLLFSLHNIRQTSNIIEMTTTTTTATATPAVAIVLRFLLTFYNQQTNGNFIFQYEKKKQTNKTKT